MGRGGVMLEINQPEFAQQQLYKMQTFKQCIFFFNCSSNSANLSLILTLGLEALSNAPSLFEGHFQLERMRD